MNDQWASSTEELRKSIQDRAIAEFLKNHSVNEIAAMAGEALMGLSEKEKASVIAILQAQSSGAVHMGPTRNGMSAVPIKRL